MISLVTMKKMRRRLDINMNRNESSFTSGTRAQPLSRHVITPLIIVIVIIIIIIVIIIVIIIIVKTEVRQGR